MLIIKYLWKGNKTFERELWLWSVPIISILSEHLQIYKLIPGTFSIMDLMCLCFIYLLYYIYERRSVYEKY